MAKGTNKKNAYAAYKNESRYTTNRRRRLNKHLANNPNDTTALAAVGNITYRRRKPKSKSGWVPLKWSRSDNSIEYNINAMSPSDKLIYGRILSFSNKVENMIAYGQIKSAKELTSGDNFKYQNEHDESVLKKVADNAQ